MSYSLLPREHFSFKGGSVIITECMDDLGIASVVWESGVRLARYLESNQERYPLAGSSVLELGAGTGIVSIVCSLLGAHVTATDMKDVLGSLSINITNNTRQGLRPSVRELSWGSDLSAFDPRAYRYIMASDLVYQEAALPLLALTLSHFLAGGAIVLFSLKTRFRFCGEFLRRLSEEHRVRTIAEWPEDEMLILEISAHGYAEGEEEVEEEVEDDGKEEEDEEEEHEEAEKDNRTADREKDDVVAVVGGAGAPKEVEEIQAGDATGEQGAGAGDQSKEDTNERVYNESEEWKDLHENHTELKDSGGRSREETADARSGKGGRKGQDEAGETRASSGNGREETEGGQTGAENEEAEDEQRKLVDETEILLNGETMSVHSIDAGWPWEELLAKAPNERQERDEEEEGDIGKGGEEGEEVRGRFEARRNDPMEGTTEDAGILRTYMHGIPPSSSVAKPQIQKIKEDRAGAESRTGSSDGEGTGTKQERPTGGILVSGGRKQPLAVALKLKILERLLSMSEEGRPRDGEITGGSEENIPEGE